LSIGGQIGYLLNMKQHRSSLALQSTISSRGRFELKLEEIRLPSPAADEIVVQMEAAPINPADLLGIFGPVDKSTLVADGTADSPIFEVMFRNRGSPRQRRDGIVRFSSATKEPGRSWRRAQTQKN